MNKQLRVNLFVLLTAASLMISGCASPVPPSPMPASPTPASPTPVSTEAVSPTPTATAVEPTRVASPTATFLPTKVPLPLIELKKNEFFFRSAGQPTFMFSRNLAGYQTGQLTQQLKFIGPGGSNFIRLTLDDLGMGYSSSGEIDAVWARNWEYIFTKAAAQGIYVIPVLGTWYDWNDRDGYSQWKSNPLSQSNGGPARVGQDLFIADSPTQKRWLQWMQTLVERWQGQENIIAWEIFSEVNMVPGTTQPQAIDFVQKAVALIRATDPLDRPVNASLADFGDWSDFYRSDSIDFISIHPYPVSGKLDSTIITEVHAMLAKYHKPVFIGESGLSFLTPDSTPATLTTADRAEIGIKHAIWAATVSGAANGRALWWEDGVAVYFPALSFAFMQKYANVDAPVANFVAGVDFTDFQPLNAISSSGIWGAVVGNQKMALGWYRDAGSEPPQWDLRPKISGESVTISVMGTAAQWQVDYYDTTTGTDMIGSQTITPQGDRVTLKLPDFKDDIAFKLTAIGNSTTAPKPVSTTDLIAGKWAGTITNDTASFSTRVELEIQSNCKPGNLCGKFSAPLLPCQGELFLQQIQGSTFAFIEQNVTGAASCAAGGWEYLQLQDDGVLRYQFAFMAEEGASSAGLLKHP